MRPSLRNALLGLVDQVPLIGSGITRAIQDHYASPREREQAELIARQQDRVRDLAGEVKRQNSFEGDRERRRRDETYRSFGGR